MTTREATLSSGFAFPVAGREDMSRADNEPVMLPTDMIWGDHMVRAELYRRPALTITLEPKVLACRYTVEIRNAENLKYVSGISGVLSGLADGLFAGKAETTDERVTIPLMASSPAIKRLLQESCSPSGNATRNVERII